MNVHSTSSSDDVAERDGLVLLLEQWEQHDGAAHVGDDQQHVEERADEHAGVGACTDDVVWIREDGAVEEHCCDRRDEGKEEKHPDDECDPACWIHLVSL